MTFEVVCTTCNKPVRAAEKHRGRTFACPGCKHPLSIPLANDPLGEPDFGDLDQLVGFEQSAGVAIGLDSAIHQDGDVVEKQVEAYMGRRVDASVSIPAETLPKIRTGLRLLFFTAILQLIAIVLASIGAGLLWAAAEMMVVEVATKAPTMLMQDSMAEPAQPDEPSTLVAMAAVTALIAGILMILAGTMYFLIIPIDAFGTFYCLWLPEKNACRRLMTASLMVKMLVPVFVVGLALLALIIPASIFVALATAVIGFAAAFTLFMMGMTRFAQYLERTELVDEALQIMITGLCLIAAGILVPGFIVAMLAMGQWTTLIVIFVCLGIVAGFMFRHAPMEFLYYGFMYGTGAGFVMRYGNFLSALHAVRTKVA